MAAAAERTAREQRLALLALADDATEAVRRMCLPPPPSGSNASPAVAELDEVWAALSSNFTQGLDDYSFLGDLSLTKNRKSQERRARSRRDIVAFPQSILLHILRRRSMRSL